MSVRKAVEPLTTNSHQICGKINVHPTVQVNSRIFPLDESGRLESDY